MQLSKQQKVILKASIPALIGMLGASVFNAIIGRQSRMDTLWISLIGLGIEAGLFGLFLLSSMVPKKNDENQ